MILSKNIPQHLEKVKLISCFNEIVRVSLHAVDSTKKPCCPRLGKYITKYSVS